MSLLQILALAPTKTRTMEIADSLADVNCRIHEGYNGDDLAKVIGATKVDVVIFAGPLPGISAERILTAVTERAPGAVLVVSLQDAGEANALASRYGGRAIPWPLQSESLRRVLTGPKQAHYMVPRREPRFRVLSSATLDVAGQSRDGLLVNISNHGAMILADVPLQKGGVVSFNCKYGLESFTLAGTVKHVGDPADSERMLSEAPWLRIKNPYLFGIEFFPQAMSQAKDLCRIVSRERNLIRLTVSCIPGIPKGLAPVFKQLGIQVEMGKSLGLIETAPPPILLVDVSTTSIDDLKRLVKLRKRSLVIGIATTPLTDPERVSAAGMLPSVFVLPFHNDDLIRHIENFFAPVDRKFPRLEHGFSVMLNTDGKTTSIDGLNVSLHGFAIRSDKKMKVGSNVEGNLAMDDATDTYSFKGEVVYSVIEGEAFRTGVSMEVERRSADGFRKYLSVRFMKELRNRWERQLRTPHGQLS